MNVNKWLVFEQRKGSSVVGNLARIKISPGVMLGELGSVRCPGSIPGDCSFLVDLFQNLATGEVNSEA